MLTHYLYNLDTKIVCAFMEGKDADSDVTLVTQRASKECLPDLKSVTIPADVAVDIRKQLSERGFVTFEQFQQQGVPFYNVTAEVSHIPYFRSGLCRRQDLEELRERFFRDFHPAGYSSDVSVAESGLNDVVFWSASRARSCD